MSDSSGTSGGGLVFCRLLFGVVVVGGVMVGGVLSGRVSLGGVSFGGGGFGLLLVGVLCGGVVFGGEFGGGVLLVGVLCGGMLSDCSLAIRGRIPSSHPYPHPSSGRAAPTRRVAGCAPPVSDSARLLGRAAAGPHDAAAGAARFRQVNALADARGLSG
ncbi:unnamed protein product [Closterium sp. Yama58-4]|nr:unnamed protein product [Closterium sp. Yama58-4]